MPFQSVPAQLDPLRSLFDSIFHCYLTSRLSFSGFVIAFDFRTSLPSFSLKCLVLVVFFFRLALLVSCSVLVNTSAQFDMVFTAGLFRASFSCHSMSALSFFFPKRILIVHGLVLLALGRGGGLRDYDTLFSWMGELFFLPARDPLPCQFFLPALR